MTNLILFNLAIKSPRINTFKMYKSHLRMVSSLMGPNPTKQKLINLYEFEMKHSDILENGYLIINSQGLIIYDSRAAIFKNKKLFVLKLPP